MVDSIGAAMRPVDRDAFTHRPTEQRIDRHVQRLAAYIEQRVLQRGDGLVVQAAARLPGENMQAGDEEFAAQRVMPDHQRRERADHLAQTGTAEAFVVFGPADDAAVRRDLHEREEPPPGICLEHVDRGDLHDILPCSVRGYWAEYRNGPVEQSSMFCRSGGAGPGALYAAYKHVTYNV